MTQKHKELNSKQSPFDVNVKLTISGADASKLQNFEIQPDALELMKSVSTGDKQQTDQFVLKSKVPNNDEARMFDDIENVETDSETDESSSGTYSYVTDSKLRRFLHKLHQKSPQRAEDACNFYVKRMTQLLQDNYKAKLDAEDTKIRLEFAHESVRLPTGHIVSTLPRVEFNYLPDDVFCELTVKHFLNHAKVFILFYLGIRSS